MHELTRIIKDDMAIALGVTEPGAIAFCAAKARSLIGGALIGLEISVNSGLYKNADACCIPNSSAFGSAHAAALGYVAGDPERGLNSLAEATPQDDALARRYSRRTRAAAHRIHAYTLKALLDYDLFSACQLQKPRI